MAKALGYVQERETGEFEGTIAMGLNSKIKIVPNEAKENDRQPDYRIFADRVGDIGGGWDKVGKNSGKPFVSLTLEHPLMGQSRIYANLGRAAGVDDGTLAILWNPQT